MKKHTEFIFNTLMLLCITLVVALMPTEKEGAIYEDTVRLHILANSDGESDQTLKLEIRDRILEKYSVELRSCATKEAAVEKLSALSEQIECDAAAWISELGEEYGCEVELGREWYDTREYEDFTLPAGYYMSLRVMLGEAEGKNWWCVMYPPLCLDVATTEEPRDDAVLGYTEEERELISDKKYNVKFKILELLSESLADFS